MEDYQQAAAAVYAVISAGPGWDWNTVSNLYPNAGVYTDHLRSRSIAPTIRIPPRRDSCWPTTTCSASTTKRRPHSSSKSSSCSPTINWPPLKGLKSASNPNQGPAMTPPVPVRRRQRADHSGRCGQRRGALERQPARRLDLEARFDRGQQIQLAVQAGREVATVQRHVHAGE